MTTVIYIRPGLTAIIAAILLGPDAETAAAQDTPMDAEVERFQLFTRCRPLFPSVTLELNSAYLDDLTQTDLEELVSTGLRSVELLGDRQAPPFLFITVGVVQWAFSVRVELMKEVQDPYTDLRGGATTWRAQRYGIHSGDKSFVLSSLSTAINGFLADYHRVNQFSCRPSGSERRPADR